MLLAAIALAIGGAANAQPQVLATVGKYEVTATELEQAIASSPFAERFVAMDQDQQAALRGDLLSRLVAARLLTLEAERLQLDQDPAFRADLDDYRRGELFQAYWNRVRNRLTLPEGEESALRERLDGQADALAAARSMRMSELFRLEKLRVLSDLRRQLNLVDYPQRLSGLKGPDTILAEGDGFVVKYEEVARLAPPNANRTELEKALYDRVELALVEQAALREGIDVSARLARFRQERLPAELLARKAREWVPDRESARSWFRQHPDIGYVPEMRHVGQIVVKDKVLADKLHERVLAGESLFRLAGEYSIDPYGRQHAGDMGWLREGSGMPVIEAELAVLPNDRVSRPVKSDRGWHLMMVIDRRPARQLRFEEVEDRVQQAMYNERLAPYLKSLQERHTVAWNVVAGGEH